MREQGEVSDGGYTTVNECIEWAMDDTSKEDEMFLRDVLRGAL